MVLTRFPPSATSIKASISGSWAASVALMWFTFHTVPLDKHSVLNVLLIWLLLVLGVGVSALGRINRTVVYAGLIIFALFVLSAMSGFLHTSALSGSRSSVLIIVFVLIGVASGFIERQDLVLVGLGMGTLFVFAQGLLLQYVNPSRAVLSGDYLGVTGRESSELLSALVGLACGLALLRETRSRRFFAVLLLLSNAFLIWRLDLTIGLVVAGVMVLLAAVVWRAEQRFLVIVRIRYLVAVATLGALVLALVAQRSFALKVAGFIGERESVEARFEIWDSAISSVSPLGLWFGHGATFWRDGTATSELTREALQGYGLSAFVHAHSMYLDLFLSFGVLGVALIVCLIVVTFRGIKPEVVEEKEQLTNTFVWVLITAFALLGISESVLLFHPPGWFLGSFLLGLLLRRSTVNSQVTFTPVASH